MRLLITGKTQSGRTTALRQLLAHLLRLPHFDQIILLDGKGIQLDCFAALPRVTFFGPRAIEAAAEALQTLADQVPDRYARPDPARRLLLAADDLQTFSRAEKFGSKIKRNLNTLAEAGALGDYLLMTAPRETGNVPPPTRAQLDARLQLIGSGLFFFRAPGRPPQSGRIEPLSVEEATALAATPLAESEPPPSTEVPHLLGHVRVEPTRAPATLYLSPPGGGKTYTLQHHPNGTTARHIYLDLAQPHRTILTQIITGCGANVPKRTPVTALAELAALAVQAEPTLLLLDNLDQASAKMIPTVDKLMTAAAAVALSANEPRTPAERRKLKPFLPRCEVCELPPLPDETARTLLWATLDRNQVEKPQAVERKVLRAAAGNPATICKLARRIQRGDATELRQLYAPVKRVNIGWIILLVIIAGTMVSRRVVDSYVALFLLTLAYVGLRPFIYRLMRADD